MLDLIPFQETLHRGMCGAASLLIVLDYYGIEKTEKELAVMLGVDERFGTDAEAIGKVAESLGLKVEIREGCVFEDLAVWLEKDIPVIVDWFSRGRSDYPDSEVADGHYSVVAGIEEMHIYLQDPEIGAVRKIKKEDFLQVWFDFAGECVTREGMIIRQSIAIYK